LLQTETGTRGKGAGRVEVFQYPAGPDAAPVNWDGWTAPAEEDALPAMPQERVSHEVVQNAVELQLRAEYEKRLADETRKAFEQGREKGRQEGRQAEHEAQAAGRSAAEEHRIRQAAELVEKFTTERDRYLHLVEQEVVQLSLAVAARILRREAQMDPLLLSGAVRVALGQLAGSTKVRLRVPPGDLDLWTQAIALLPNLAVKPEVVSGEEMRLGDCLVETDLGSVDLGIRSQLGEIERGFFDRAGIRHTPAAQPVTVPLSSPRPEDLP
jgi:flagellar assembly protein FliH